MQNNIQIPKISLVISIYNGAKFIERCMNSVYAQKFDGLEIILVNDGSTDNTRELIETYAEKDDRIIVINKENGGLGSARNAGMKVAKGEYITFPDVDDWFESDMCKDLYALAKSGDYDVVIAGANNYSQKLDLINTVNYPRMSFVSNKECFSNIMKFFPTTLLFDVVWNKLYKRKFLIENGLCFSDLRRAQDAYFSLEVFEKITSLITTEKAYYNYLNNEVAQVNLKFPINYIDINIKYYYKLKEVFGARGLYNGDIKIQYDTSFVETIYATINMFDNPRWRLDKNQQRQYIVDILNRTEVTEYLKDAAVRADALDKFKLIKNKDVDKIIKLHNKEKFKDSLRKNKLLMKIYHVFKK